MKVIRLCWETQKSLEMDVWFCQPGVATISVQPEWDTATVSCYQC